MKHKKWLLLVPGIAVLAFLTVTAGKTVVAGNTNELAKILEAGVEGFKAYLDWLLEVLKVIW